MKGRIQKWRTARLCGLWALRERSPVALPRDVRRYVGRYLEWVDDVYCWICLRRMPLCLRFSCALFVDDDDNPIHPDPLCAYELCQGTPPLFPSRSTPEPHEKEMLDAFDFLCALSGRESPSGRFGYRNTIHNNALRLASHRKHKANARARADILREEREHELERKTEQREARREQRHHRRRRQRGK